MSTFFVPPFNIYVYILYINIYSDRKIGFYEKSENFYKLFNLEAPGGACKGYLRILRVLEDLE